MHPLKVDELNEKGVRQVMREMQEGKHGTFTSEVYADTQAWVAHQLALQAEENDKAVKDSARVQARCAVLQTIIAGCSLIAAGSAVAVSYFR